MQVLNLLLYKLSGEEPDAGLLDFLRADEHLVDIGDDLVDYEVNLCVQSYLQLHNETLPASVPPFTSDFALHPNDGYVTAAFDNISARSGRCAGELFQRLQG